MTADHEPTTRRLIVGEQTKAVEPGVKIVVPDSFEQTLTVEKVEKGGHLSVKVKELQTGQTYTALMVKGTPITIQDPE
jgi:hypothetical protein